MRCCISRPVSQRGCCTRYSALREFVIPAPVAFRRIVLGLTTFRAQVSASWLGLLIGGGAKRVALHCTTRFQPLSGSNIVLDDGARRRPIEEHLNQRWVSDRRPQVFYLHLSVSPGGSGHRLRRFRKRLLQRHCLLGHRSAGAIHSVGGLIQCVAEAAHAR